MTRVLDPTSRYSATRVGVVVPFAIYLRPTVANAHGPIRFQVVVQVAIANPAGSPETTSLEEAVPFSINLMPPERNRAILLEITPTVSHFLPTVLIQKRHTIRIQERRWRLIALLQDIIIAVNVSRHARSAQRCNKRALSKIGGSRDIEVPYTNAMQSLHRLQRH